MSDAPTVVVAERPELPTDTVARTPAGMADLRVVVMNGAAMVAVRAARTFLQVFVAALIGAAAGPSVPVVSDALPPSQAGERLLAAVYLAAIAALISAAQNAAELLGKLDSSHPELRA
jgi:hypothetical protein